MEDHIHCPNCGKIANITVSTYIVPVALRVCNQCRKDKIKRGYKKTKASNGNT